LRDSTKERGERLEKEKEKRKRERETIVEMRRKKEIINNEPDTIF
jgi:hypothetical protein